MEGGQNHDLVRKAAQVINPKIKKYKLPEVKNILQSEYPVDEPVTDTKMSALSLACSLTDAGQQLNDLNAELLHLILSKNPNLNYQDKFKRQPLHLASIAGNMTAVKILLEYGLPGEDGTTKSG